MKILEFLKGLPLNVWLMLGGALVALAGVFGGVGALLGAENVEVKEGYELVAVWIGAALFGTGVLFRLLLMWKGGPSLHPATVALVLLMLPLLTGCGTSAEQFWEAIQLDPCEIGYVDVSGTFDVSGNPLVTTNVYVEMREEHTAETIPQDCPGFRPAAPDPPPAS